MDLVARARDWLSQDPDPETRAELSALLDCGDEAALADRFATKLEFGTAGLRGALGPGPGRMNRVTVMRAAAGIGSVLGPGRSVVIGFDARRKSDAFAHDTAAVLTGAGLTAYLLPRPLPTPVLAFAVRQLGADAGIMVTASHNPPRDNGYKVYWSDGAQIVPPIDAQISAAIDAVGRVDALPLGSAQQATGDRPGGGRARWRTLDDGIVEAYLRALSRLPLGDAGGCSVVYTPLHGVGREVLTRAFLLTGGAAPTTVPEQAEPDPDFPTVAFPNPEEPGAMDLAYALGASSGADLVLANDPDADRCAVAVPEGAGYRPLTGDELGGLLAEHVLRNTHGDDRLVVTTIVSSSLLEKIARSYRVRYAESLTGFKWIVRSGAPEERLVYCYEEALGYCIGGDDGVPVRDKDGISAARAVAGLAAAAKRSGRTLLDLVDDQARRFGLHATRPLSFRVDDLSLIGAAMARLRKTPPATLGGRPVTVFDDLATGAFGLPPTEGLRFRLSGDGRVIVRPSGTEPKLKCYLEVVVPVIGPMREARARAAGDLDALCSDLTIALGLADVDR